MSWVIMHACRIVSCILFSYCTNIASRLSAITNKNDLELSVSLEFLEAQLAKNCFVKRKMYISETLF